MTVPGSPTVRRRRLAAELREIRESEGKSGDAVAAALNWSPSKISRYELARTGLKPREVERLLDYYEITGDRRALLLSLAEEQVFHDHVVDELSPALRLRAQQHRHLAHPSPHSSAWTRVTGRRW